MGLFSKRGPSVDDAAQKAEGNFVKAWQDASGRGLLRQGALLCGQGWQGKQGAFVIVYPHGVEVVRLPKAGAMFGGGATSEMYPANRIGSVSVQVQGIYAMLVLSGSGFVAEYRTSHAEAVVLQRYIQDAIMRD